MTRPFRRRLTLTREGDAVDGELEDHIHHVGVRVSHAGGAVAGIEGRAMRLPWSTCPDAVELLDELIGAPVGALPRAEDARQHCTHLLDLARMTIAFAGRDVDALVVTATVHDWDTATPRVEVTGDDGSPEAALHVKRAMWIAPSRGFDLDTLDTIDQSMLSEGLCYSSQPRRFTIARRNRGSSLQELR